MFYPPLENMWESYLSTSVPNLQILFLMVMYYKQVWSELLVLPSEKKIVVVINQLSKSRQLLQFFNMDKNYALFWNSRKGPLRGPFPRPSGVGGIRKPMANMLDGRTSVGRTDICRTDGQNLSDGRTHSNAPEKTLYIRKTFLFMLRSAPKLFYYHQLGERIPKMGLDLKSVHGKGSN